MYLTGSPGIIFMITNNMIDMMMITGISERILLPKNFSIVLSFFEN